MTRLREFNLDGLPGPTHNYAGLSHGNLASTTHGGHASSPQTAALQGIAKMEALASRGLGQLVMPPQHRPDLDALRRLGYAGSNESLLRDTPLPELARHASASAMWTANAATVFPSTDTLDGRTHLVVANLHDRFHRTLEAPQTTRTLRAVFADPERFAVHAPAPSHPDYADEGAANHTRLVGTDGQDAMHLFAYGREGGVSHTRLPARQSLYGSTAVARIGQLDPSRAVFARNTARAIDAGVFHNDVIAVGNDQVLLAHECAFVDQDALIAELGARIEGLCAVVVPERDLPLADAVSTYLFNSQLVTLGDGRMLLVAPADVARSETASEVVARIVADAANPIGEVLYLDLRESMRNGGGPACLRLRVALRDDDAACLRGNVRLEVSESPVASRPGHVTSAALRSWVGRYYRDRLVPDDLRDPQLGVESREALDALSTLLGLGSIYPFQT
jgi:succinylarginine dihydrolase